MPVRNEQGTLKGRLLRMLEILPELTHQFEMIVVDDASTDATIEVADEVRGMYPQLGVVGHTIPAGRVAAIQTGLARCAGEVVFLADADCCLALDRVGELWRALARYDIVLARPAPWPPNLLPPVPSGSLGGGYQMGLHRVFCKLAEALADQNTLVAALRRQGWRWHEVWISGRMLVGLAGRFDRGQPGRQSSLHFSHGRSLRADEPEPLAAGLTPSGCLRSADPALARD